MSRCALAGRSWRKRRGTCDVVENGLNDVFSEVRYVVRIVLA